MSGSPIQVNAQKRLRLHYLGVAFDDVMGKGAMFSPLDVGRPLATLPPVGVEDTAGPERPNICGRVSYVVSHPNDLLIRAHRERSPGAMNVVLATEVTGEDVPR